MTDLFYVENHKLVINAEEIRKFPYLGRLFARDSNPNKVQAYKELMLVWFWCNYKSPYRDYSPYAEKVRKCLKNSSLPPNFTLDKTITECFKEYEEAQEAMIPAVRVASVVKAGLNNSVAVLEELNKNIVTKLEKIKNVTELDTEAAKVVQSLISSVNTISALSNEFPKTLDNIDKIEERIRKEAGKKEKVGRGGQSKSMFENPEDIRDDN